MIEPATSAWSLSVVFVHKKDQSWHFCVDYKKLNARLLPRIDLSLDGSRYPSTLDLMRGYWQGPKSVPINNLTELLWFS